MSHVHSHAHAHHHAIESVSTTLIACILLNLLFVIVEAGIGFTYHSLGLLSDAGHNLSDVFSLLLSLFAIRMATRKANSHFTYGYKKSTVLVSLVNAVILLIAVGGILIESIYKLKSTIPISGEAISWTAGVGILINGTTALLLMKGQKNDLNIKGAFLHMAMDTLVSVGVVVSGILISFTQCYLIDAFIGMAIALIILVSTWKLLKESLYLCLDAVPEQVQLDKLETAIGQTPGVASWHHLHVWAVSTTENAATLHVVIRNLAEMEDTKRQLKQLLSTYGITHSTIEFETSETHCCDASEGCYRQTRR
ncbi:cation diffusion facilitator family transporter [Bacteroides mediterraneensis]|uniref:cation diffusion facilitator family transporter n=1 Tax=Bacteroides mediterraneensis TaxID=1841856 RepID=UPI0009352982|nr:cation diffusion facilitator family transporter [Bacteroides mediterraneensis]